LIKEGNPYDFYRQVLYMDEKDQGRHYTLLQKLTKDPSQALSLEAH